MSTLFSKIITGEIPSYKIYENDLVFAFLDIEPLEKGHILIVPKIEIDKFNDVPEPYYSAVFLTAKKIVKAMEKALDIKRVATAIVGIDVPHFHYHLVPIINGNPLTNSPKKFSDEEMKLTAEKIAEELNKK